MRLPHCPTRWNHSYCTGIPHSAPHSLQPLQSGASSPLVQISASTRESHSAATPSSVSCPQVIHSAIIPQVQTGLTHTATSDLMSATLAEAATQLFFAEFLERCILLRASPLPTPTQLLDAATQTIPHIAVSQDVYNSRSRSSPSDVPPARSLGGLGSTFDARRFLSDVFPTHPSATPRRGCADPCAKCCIYRCHHPTTAHGVLHRVHQLQ